MDRKLALQEREGLFSEIEARFVEAGSWSFEANWQGK